MPFLQIFRYVISLSVFVHPVMSLVFYADRVVQRPQEGFRLLDGKIVHLILFAGLSGVFLLAGI